MTFPEIHSAKPNQIDRKFPQPILSNAVPAAISSPDYSYNSTQSATNKRIISRSSGGHGRTHFSKSNGHWWEVTMSRISKNALLSAITVFVVGFAINIQAGKPAADQIISYGPIHGESWLCLARNLSDENLTITWDFILFDGSEASTHTVSSLVVNAGSSVGSALNLGQGEIVDCAVTWEGQKGDVRGTLCAFEENNAEGIIGCFELN